MLIDRANLMLDAWDDGLVTSEEVREWGESELLAIASAAAPSWLLDLVQHGPQAVAEAGHEWRRRPAFKIRFALRATRLDLEDRPSVEAFARWLRSAALGQDLANPEVLLGYEVDHCLDDLSNVDLAVQCVRDGLPPLLDRCRATLAAHLA